MKKLACLMAAAACLTVGPAVAQSARITVGVDDGYSSRGRVVVRDNDRWHHNRWRAHRSYASDRIVIRSNPDYCRTVTVRTKLANGTVIIKKQRRCG